MKNVVSLILGGGRGSRLFPLTKDRSKPAVPLGGKYRLIDIPITNCLRSNLNRMFILTQFNSESLNKHIIQTYRFDTFHSGFVNILAAEQTDTSSDWYQGTADAVRKNLRHVLAFHNITHVLILSGDQIYKMDYRQLLQQHKESKVGLTICVKPVFKEETSSFGIMKVDKNLITDFVEKPKDFETLYEFQSREAVQKHFPNIGEGYDFFASMGIYLFDLETLLEILDNSYTDFGNEIIPYTIENKKVGAYFFDGYWEDVGSIKTFWQANLDFTAPLPKYNLYDNFIYTHARYLPPSKVVQCNIEEAILAEGSVIQRASIRKSVIGIRSIIKDNVVIENSVVMGADYYESEENIQHNMENNRQNIGIGENSMVKNAIIDKNSRIGKNCKIVNHKNIKNFEGENYYIKDHIVIIPKNSVIEDNTMI